MAFLTSHEVLTTIKKTVEQNAKTYLRAVADEMGTQPPKTPVAYRLSVAPPDILSIKNFPFCSIWTKSTTLEDAGAGIGRTAVFDVFVSIRTKGKDFEDVAKQCSIFETAIGALIEQQLPMQGKKWLDYVQVEALEHVIIDEAYARNSSEIDIAIKVYTKALWDTRPPFTNTFTKTNITTEGIK